MNDPLLIDTDVLIDYLRGRTEAVKYVESLQETLMISAITIAELYAGVREGKERTILDNFLTAFEVIELNKDIALQGGLFRRGYGKSHNTGLADALIAASAEYKKAMLVTLNKKHFPMVSKLTVPYQKP